MSHIIRRTWLPLDSHIHNLHIAYGLGCTPSTNVAVRNACRRPAGRQHTADLPVPAFLR